MRNIVKILLATVVLTVAMVSTAFADNNDMGHYVVPVEALNDGGYSSYFKGMDTGDNVGITRIYLCKNGIKVKGCWVFDDAPGGLNKWYIVDNNGLLKGLVHDNYYDTWYLLDDHGRLITQSGAYALETLTFNGDRTVGYPFTFGTYTMNLVIDPVSGAITNMRMGIAENQKLYYNTITRSGYNPRTGAVEAMPSLYTSKMNEYSDAYLKQLALDGATRRGTSSMSYWDYLLNADNKKAAAKADAADVANGGYNATLGVWEYVDKDGFLCGSKTKPTKEWLAANGAFAVDENIHVDMQGVDYYINTGITRPDLPAYTKY